MSEYDIIIFYIRYMLVDRVEGSYQMASGAIRNTMKVNHSSDFAIYFPNIRSLKINRKTEPCNVKYLHTYHFNNSLICLLIPMGNQYHLGAWR